MESNNVRKAKTLTALVLADLYCLVAQFLLGTYVNLYVQFPDSLPGGNAWAWTLAHSGITTLHIALGTAIIVLSGIVLVLSIVQRHGTAIVTSALGLLMVLFAWFSGDRFLENVQNNTFSYMMAVGFIGAVSFYIWQIYVLARKT